MKRLLIGISFICLLLSNVRSYAGVSNETKALFEIACDLNGYGQLQRQRAISELISKGKNSEEFFIQKLSAEKTIEKQIAAEVLGGCGSEKAEAALIRALSDRDVFLQGAAGRALAVLYSRLPQELLAERLLTTDKPIVSLAVMYGGYKRARYNGEELDPELLSAVGELLLKVDDEMEIQAAVTLLKYADTQDAVLALLDIAGKTENADIQIEVCRALAAIAPEGKAPQIERLAICGKPRVEVEAWNALSAMGYKDTDKALSGLAVNPDPRVQKDAIRYLAKAGAKYDPLFISALKSSDPDVRLQALLALSRTASVYAATDIARMMGTDGDRNPVVRARAALVFAELTHSGGLAPLLEDARNENEKMLEFRLEAIKALGELGDRGALRALIDMLRDDDMTVRILAARSLGRIGDSRAITKLEEMYKLRKGEEKIVLGQVIESLRD